MKYLKTYENYLFDINDKVKLDTLITSYRNRIYIIFGKRNSVNGLKYFIQSDDDDKISFWEYESNLKKATPEEIENYQIKITTKKYNL